MLVTAVDVVDAATDNALLAPMVEQAEETTGTRVPMTLADAGYFAASHVAECVRRGQQVVVPEARQRFLKDPYPDVAIWEVTPDNRDSMFGEALAWVGQMARYST